MYTRRNAGLQALVKTQDSMSKIITGNITTIFFFQGETEKNPADKDHANLWENSMCVFKNFHLFFNVIRPVIQNKILKKGYVLFKKGFLTALAEKRWSVQEKW